MKYLSICVIVLVLLVNNINAFNLAEYVADIEELSRDKGFVEEYMKWSIKLFSESDYLFGKSNGPFPCPIKKEYHSIPTSVHQLRPSDVKCIAAIGDSITAGLGAHALTPVGLIVENRGKSFFVG